MISLYIRRILTFFCLCIVYTNMIYAQTDHQIQLPYQIDFNKIESEREHINYTLDEIVQIIEDSIKSNNKVAIPEVCTEFEKALFTARRIQHNDSQLVAIKFFKTLLEFECYRTRGEELYLKLLLGFSIQYLGAPRLAHKYIRNVFPDIFTELTNPMLKGSFLDNYANTLIQIDSIHAAQKIFENNLLLYKRLDLPKKVYSTQNNLGFTYILLGKYDFAKILFRQNQKVKFKSQMPVLHAFSFGNYGNILYREKKYDSALYYYKVELTQLQQIETHEGLPNLYSSIGDIYKEQGFLDSATYYYRLALEEASFSKNLPKVVEIHEDLIKIYSIKGGTSELSNLLESYLVLNDSLNNRKKLKDANLEVQVTRFLKIFSDTEDSKKRNDHLKQGYKDLTYILFALSIITLLLLFILYLRNNNRKKLQEKNVELKTKNIQLKQSYELISESNDNNGILLKELHHRVKNNLQIISSLFNLQLNASKLNNEAQTVFKDAQNRIQSIAAVHRKMYQSNKVDSLDFEQYVRDFSNELIKLSSKEVTINIKIRRDPISIESAVPLGLIFNELLTNSLKYAVSHEPLVVSMQHEFINGKEQFIYTDNGIGFTNTKRIEDSKNSIGFSLIQLLAKQLEAEIEYNGEGGFWLSIAGNFE